MDIEKLIERARDAVDRLANAASKTEIDRNLGQLDAILDGIELEHKQEQRNHAAALGMISNVVIREVCEK